MKHILIIIILIFTQNVPAQNILGEYWQINKIIGSDIQNTQKFRLNKIKVTTKKHYVYGNKIIFNDDNTFTCSYFAPCGNDCFPSSIGTFKMIDEKHINLFVKEFNQSGICKNKHIQLNIDLGIYYISKKSDKIIELIKIN